MRLKIFIPIILILLVLTQKGYAQSGISLYHLNNATYQGNNFNPAFMPEGKFILGLPVLSGIAVDFNSPVSYNDLVTTNEVGELEFDFKNVADISSDRNFFSVNAEISSLFLAFRTKSTSAISFFIRERISAKGFYSGDLVKLWNGNTQFVNSEINLNNTMADARYYREYGIGLWKSIPNQGINFGVRFKFLNGMASIITQRGFEGTVDINQDYAHNFNLSSGRVNTSGYDLLKSGEQSDITSHLISNDNIGMGIDLGLHWKINKQLSAAVSVNDLGFINWKVDPKNLFLKDTTFAFNGADLVNNSDFGGVIDSLTNSFVDSTTNEGYTSGLNTSAFGSLMYQLTPNDLFTGTISGTFVQDELLMLYAMGYTRKVGNILRVSGNVIRTPQQGVDIGLGLAATFGAFQMYMASDKLIKVWNVPETKAVDFRFGINFVFGRTKVVKDDRSDLYHPSPYGKGERVEKSDGIYWIIKKQSPRPIYTPSKNITGG